MSWIRRTHRNSNRHHLRINRFNEYLFPNSSDFELTKVMGLIYPVLRKLKIDLKRKVTLFGLFSLGSFSLLCNVVRTVKMLESPFTGSYFWATAEITVAIICASIPTIRPLFDKKVWINRSSAEWCECSLLPLNENLPCYILAAKRSKNLGSQRQG